MSAPGGAGSEFNGHLEAHQGAVRLTLEGKLDQREPEKFLRPLLARLHDLAASTKAGSVEIDLTALEVMNSAAVRAVLAYIGSVQVMVGHRYGVRFVITSARRWQGPTVNAVKAWGGDFIEIATTSPAT